MRLALVRSILVATILVTAAALAIVSPPDSRATPVPPIYSVTVNESGLWPGWGWGLTVNGTGYSSSTNSTVLFLPNGSYSWSASSSWYTAVPGSGTLNVTGANVSLNITFSPDEAIGELAGQFFYDLPIGGNESYQWTIINYGAPAWVVPEAGTQIPYGTYPNSTPPIVTFDPSSGFALLPSTEYTVTVTVTVPENLWDDGASWHGTLGAAADYNGTCPPGDACVNPGIAKILYGGAFYPYFTNWTESGLPKGTPWSVFVYGGEAMGSSTTSKISVIWQNGTWPFAIYVTGDYTATPSTGTIVVSGADIKVHIRFAPTKHTVRFDESGLPHKTSWSVTVGATTRSSTSSSIAFYLPDGTYAYSVPNVANYSRTPTGTFTVNGANVTVSEKFTLVKYAVTFNESGLPSGRKWNVTIGSTTHFSRTTQLSFDLRNGSYSYSVGKVSGYTVMASGTFTLGGSPISVFLTFSKGAGSAARPESSPVVPDELRHIVRSSPPVLALPTRFQALERSVPLR